MSIALIIAGTILILGGVLSITEKWMWLQQGYVKRPVRVNEYMRYMGMVDIIGGLFWLSVGVVKYGQHINNGLVILSGLLLVVLKIYGEFRYRVKQTH